MRYVLLLLVQAAWALWFGGTIATFVFGLNLFQTHPGIAGEANSAMFVVFSKYELALAAVAILSTGLLLVTYPAKAALGLLSCLIISAGIAITVALGLIPQMESLRTQGRQQSDEFKKYHGKSMIAMTMQSVMLLGSGAVLLVAARPLEEPVEPEPDTTTPSEYEPMFDDRKRI